MEERQPSVRFNLQLPSSREDDGNHHHHRHEEHYGLEDRERAGGQYGNESSAGEGRHGSLKDTSASPLSRRDRSESMLSASTADANIEETPIASVLLWIPNKIKNIGKPKLEDIPRGRNPGEFQAGKWHLRRITAVINRAERKGTLKILKPGVDTKSRYEIQFEDIVDAGRFIISQEKPIMYDLSKIPANDATATLDNTDDGDEYGLSRRDSILLGRKENSSFSAAGDSVVFENRRDSSIIDGSNSVPTSADPSPASSPRGVPAAAGETAEAARKRSEESLRTRMIASASANGHIEYVYGSVGLCIKTTKGLILNLAFRSIGLRDSWYQTLNDAICDHEQTIIFDQMNSNNDNNGHDNNDTVGTAADGQGEQGPGADGRSTHYYGAGGTTTTQEDISAEDYLMREQTTTLLYGADGEPLASQQQQQQGSSKSAEKDPTELGGVSLASLYRNRPDSKSYITHFLKGAEEDHPEGGSGGTKQMSQSSPPNGGFISMISPLGKTQIWQAEASEDEEGIVYFRKLNQRILNKPFEAVKSKLPASIRRQHYCHQILLGRTVIRILKPFSGSMILEQSVNDEEHQEIELVADTLEQRVKWQEWFSMMGGTVIDESAKEQAAKEKAEAAKEKEMMEMMLQEGGLDGSPLSVEGGLGGGKHVSQVGKNFVAEAMRPRGRSSIAGSRSHSRVASSLGADDDDFAQDDPLAAAFKRRGGGGGDDFDNDFSDSPMRRANSASRLKSKVSLAEERDKPNHAASRAPTLSTIRGGQSSSSPRRRPNDFDDFLEEDDDLVDSNNNGGKSGGRNNKVPAIDNLEVGLTEAQLSQSIVAPIVLGLDSLFGEKKTTLPKRREMPPPHVRSFDSFSGSFSSKGRQAFPCARTVSPSPLVSPPRRSLSPTRRGPPSQGIGKQLLADFDDSIAGAADYDNYVSSPPVMPLQEQRTGSQPNRGMSLGGLSSGSGAGGQRAVISPGPRSVASAYSRQSPDRNQTHQESVSPNFIPLQQQQEEEYAGVPDFRTMLGERPVAELGKREQTEQIRLPQLSEIGVNTKTPSPPLGGGGASVYVSQSTTRDVSASTSPSLAMFASHHHASRSPYYSPDHHQSAGVSPSKKKEKTVGTAGRQYRPTLTVGGGGRYQPYSSSEDDGDTTPLSPTTSDGDGGRPRSSSRRSARSASRVSSSSPVRRSGLAASHEHERQISSTLSIEGTDSIKDAEDRFQLSTTSTTIYPHNHRENGRRDPGGAATSEPVRAESMRTSAAPGHPNGCSPLRRRNTAMEEDENVPWKRTTFGDGAREYSLNFKTVLTSSTTAEAAAPNDPYYKPRAFGEFERDRKTAAKQGLIPDHLRSFSKKNFGSYYLVAKPEEEEQSGHHGQSSLRYPQQQSRAPQAPASERGDVDFVHLVLGAPSEVGGDNSNDYAPGIGNRSPKVMNIDTNNNNRLASTGNTFETGSNVSSVRPLSTNGTSSTLIPELPSSHHHHDDGSRDGGPLTPVGSSRGINNHQHHISQRNSLTNVSSSTQQRKELHARLRKSAEELRKAAALATPPPEEQKQEVSEEEHQIAAEKENPPAEIVNSSSFAPTTTAAEIGLYFCAICNQDKATVAICATTGRKHIISDQNRLEREAKLRQQALAAKLKAQEEYTQLELEAAATALRDPSRSFARDGSYYSSPAPSSRGLTLPNSNTTPARQTLLGTTTTANAAGAATSPIGNNSTSTFRGSPAASSTAGRGIGGQPTSYAKAKSIVEEDVRQFTSKYLNAY